MTPKTALICGISGQDGAYLAEWLLKQGYIVYGSSRDAQVNLFQNLRYLNIYDKIKLESIALNDFRSVLQAISKIKPHEIYNLAGQSSVGLSFQQPIETLESIAVSTFNLLETLRFTGIEAKFYNASSSECFGDTGGKSADENTSFHPRSPYAVAKATAHWAVSNYREAYGLFACSGILFNHESPLRPERFVTRKITATAVRIAKGSQEKLSLGNLSICRDWGWAPEYVQAMWLMLQQNVPDDFVIATGKSYSLEEFLANAFECVGLDWREYVTVDSTLLRPFDLPFSKGYPAKAYSQLNWKAQYDMQDVVRFLIEAELNRTGII